MFTAWIFRHGPRDGKPIDFSRLFFDEEVLELYMLHSETRRYTDQYLERERASRAAPTSEGTRVAEGTTHHEGGGGVPCPADCYCVLYTCTYIT